MVYLYWIYFEPSNSSLSNVSVQQNTYLEIYTFYTTTNT